MSNDLISRKALLEKIEQIHISVTGARTGRQLLRDGLNALLKAIYKIIKEAPPVDAVEVVRCKDCKYWGGRHASNECSLITKLGNPDYWLKTLPTDYCSSGAKMDGDKND